MKKKSKTKKTLYIIGTIILSLAVVYVIGMTVILIKVAEKVNETHRELYLRQYQEQMKKFMPTI